MEETPPGSCEYHHLQIWSLLKFILMMIEMETQPVKKLEDEEDQDVYQQHNLKE